MVLSAYSGSFKPVIVICQLMSWSLLVIMILTMPKGTQIAIGNSVFTSAYQSKKVLPIPFCETISPGIFLEIKAKVFSCRNHNTYRFALYHSMASFKPREKSYCGS